MTVKRFKGCREPEIRRVSLSLPVALGVFSFLHLLGFVVG